MKETLLLDTTLAFRVPRLARLQAEAIASELGQSPSEWLRSIIFQALENHQQIKPPVGESNDI